MSLNRAKNIARVLTAMIGMTFGIALSQPVMAETVKLDHGPFATTLNLPIYQWQDDQQAPRAVVLAIHGMTMHGTVFDTCARKLVAQGAVVVAPDLRGYGAWNKNGKNTEINYAQSEKDILALASAIREHYKGLPVFAAGESLGGSLSIRLAAKHPELVDGVILASPAIKMYHSTKVFVGCTLALAKRDHAMDVSGQVEKNFSEDVQITNEGISDPLMRKHLSMRDVWKSLRFIAGTGKYIDKIPAAIPVLVLQGDSDRIVQPKGVAMLASGLKTTDKTVQILPRRGHILIETQYVHSEDLNTIVSWVDNKSMQYNHNHSPITVAQR